MPTTETPRLLLHIGMHKTGSTSLQRFFVRNRLPLRMLGINYPDACDATGKRLPKHNDLFHAISHEKDHGRAHPQLGPSADLVRKLADRIGGYHTTVISAEGLSGEHPAFSKAFAPLRDRFDIRVVCFLRRQDDWAQSFYKQMVQSREVCETRSFADFIAATSTREHLDYAKLLGWWADALGHTTIRVEIYRPSTRVLPAFLNAAGLSKWLTLLPFSGCTQNRSLMSGYVERLRVANETSLKRPSPVETDTDIPYFTPSDRERFLKSYEAMNEGIRARFRPDLSRLFD